MSRFVCDTSCLVAAVCSWHEHHHRTRAEIERRTGGTGQLVPAAHSLVETCAALTRLPPPGRLRAKDAIGLIEANWRDAPVEYLTVPETWGALREAERRGAVGGRMYDVLIATTALKAQASTLLTWNVRHFTLFADEIGIQSPP